MKNWGKLFTLFTAMVIFSPLIMFFRIDFVHVLLACMIWGINWLLFSTLLVNPIVISILFPDSYLSDDAQRLVARQFWSVTQKIAFVGLIGILTWLFLPSRLGFGLQLFPIQSYFRWRELIAITPWLLWFGLWLSIRPKARAARQEK